MWILATESYSFFQDVSITEFLGGTKWSPLLRPQSFGVLPLVCGTLHIVLGASLFAIPVGLLSAIYLREYASARTQSILKPVLELLAGIPTVVYGYFALTYMTPLIKEIIPGVQIFNSASASLVVGIMILPMVCSLCDDALRSIPEGLREGGFAMGATSLEVTTQIALPAAASGVFASFVLAISRAIGETMVVTLAAGATPNLTADPRESIQTITAYIVQVSLGDAPAGTTSYKTLFAVAALLFVITLVINLLANLMLRRYKAVYE
ncbi:MAG: phosphate ABC transporter permease subunit PstC [Pirellulaceae bacterium]|nr:phosphate ABC transporter permease subunit PstC [Pirellulaceae bacterium]